MKKKLNLTQRKTAIFFILLVLALGALFVSFKKGEVVVDHEEVVFIRNLEKSGFGYVATVDQASNLLPDGVTSEGNTRGVTGVNSLSVDSSTKVFLVGESNAISVGDLAEKISSDPTYAGRVFTVGINDYKIVSIKEEDL